MVRPERLEEARSLLFSLLEPTRRENGCIEYELLQSLDDPLEFTLVSEWVSDDAFIGHLASPHMQTGARQVNLLFTAPPEIRRYKLLG
jgi:quinol monooxygenase YgiN